MIVASASTTTRVPKCTLSGRINSTRVTTSSSATALRPTAFPMRRPSAMAPIATRTFGLGARRATRITKAASGASATRACYIIATAVIVLRIKHVGRVIGAKGAVGRVGNREGEVSSVLGRKQRGRGKNIFCKSEGHVHVGKCGHRSIDLQMPVQWPRPLVFRLLHSGISTYSRDVQTPQSHGRARQPRLAARPRRRCRFPSLGPSRGRRPARCWSRLRRVFRALQ